MACEGYENVGFECKKMEKLKGLNDPEEHVKKSIEGGLSLNQLVKIMETIEEKEENEKQEKEEEKLENSVATVEPKPSGKTKSSGLSNFKTGALIVSDFEKKLK